MEKASSDANLISVLLPTRNETRARCSLACNGFSSRSGRVQLKEHIFFDGENHPSLSNEIVVVSSSYIAVIRIFTLYRYSGASFKLNINHKVQRARAQLKTPHAE